MSETELKKLASAYAAGKYSFIEYRRLRSQFLCNLTDELDSNEKQHDNARTDGKWKAINPIAFAAMIILIVLGILFIFIK